MADETQGTEQSIDDQLEALLGGGKETKEPGSPESESGSGAPPKPDEKPVSDTSPKPADKPAEEDPLAKLDAIEEEGKAEAKADDKPAGVSEEQALILRAIPTGADAMALYETQKSYDAIVSTFESGNFEQVEAMFKAWNPAVFERFLEDVYQKKVATGEWVDRYVGEADPEKAETFKRQSALEKKVEALQRQLEQENQRKQQNQQQSTEKQSFQAYNDHVHSLFDQINFSKADRRWVMSELNAKVAGDTKLLGEIKRGNMKAVNSTFKAVTREYLTRDKEISTTTEQKVAAQLQKPAPLGGGAGTKVETEILPDDVRDVPKGKEGAWMDQALGKLFKKK
jgi:hypothetical protein